MVYDPVTDDMCMVVDKGAAWRKLMRPSKFNAGIVLIDVEVSVVPQILLRRKIQGCAVVEL